MGATGSRIVSVRDVTYQPTRLIRTEAPLPSRDDMSRPVRLIGAAKG